MSYSKNLLAVTFCLVGYACYGQNEFPSTEAELTDLVKHLKADLPKNVPELTKELEKVENFIQLSSELIKDESTLIDLNSELKEAEKFSQLEESIKKLQSQFSKFIPNTAVNDDVFKLISDLSEKIGSLRFRAGLRSFKNQILENNSKFPTQARIDIFKDLMSIENIKQHKDDTDQQIKDIRENILTFQVQKNYATEIKNSCIARREQISKRLDEYQVKDSKNDFLERNLIWLAVILAVFGIGAIATVRLFTQSVQEEWVASGQVIQFVTVMILLIIILCLALLDIVQENTIGTLLGGIGGYVLSQGIGRAATRATQQAILTQSSITTPRNPSSSAPTQNSPSPSGNPAN